MPTNLFSVRTSESELLLTILLQYELFPYQFWHTNRLYMTLSLTNFLNTNIILYELLTLRTFAFTNFFYANIVSYEHCLTNMCLRTFSYTNINFTNFSPGSLYTHHCNT